MDHPAIGPLVATPEGAACARCGALVRFGHAYLISYIDGRAPHCSKCPPGHGWDLDFLRELLSRRGAALGRPLAEIQQLQAFLGELHESALRTGHGQPPPQVDTDGGELSLAWLNVRDRRSIYISIEDGEVVLSNVIDTAGQDYPSPSAEVLDAGLRDFWKPQP